MWPFPSDDNEPTNVDLSGAQTAQAGMTKERDQEYAVDAVENYKQKIVEERRRQAKIKRKYGIKSLGYLIGELDADLAKLYERQVEGEKVDQE